MKKKMWAMFSAIALAAGLLPGTALAAGDEDTYLSRQTNLTQINYPAVWEQGFDGTGVTIAVIDTGAYTQHEELRGGNVLPTVNMLDSDPGGDSNGHGTFITGMLAAPRNNGVGIAGMVDGATILPFKCFSDAGETDLSYVVRAIYSAVDDYGCDVINLSLGVEQDISALRGAVDHAVDKGIIVVAPVGNDGSARLSYPAAYDSVVGVGSVDAKNNVSDFSQRNESVFVVAPGEELISTYIKNDRSYVSWEGTSFACVHVTALAAVAKQYDPGIDAARFMELLRCSAVDLGTDGYDESSGWGLVNAGAFLDAMCPEPPDAPAGSFTDVPESAYYAAAVAWAAANGYVKGVGDGLFVPGRPCTNVEILTFLWNAEGQPEAAAAPVAVEAWFQGAVNWACEKKIIDSADRLYAPCTRANMVYYIWRVFDPETPGDGVSFTDVPSGEYYTEAVAWAVGEGIVRGTGDGAFGPDGASTRGQMAALLYQTYVPEARQK